MAPAIVRCCCGVVRWGPVVFIVGIVGWSYYAYVFEMCIFNSRANTAQKVIYLLLYHPILFIFMWSYWQCIFTRTASPPRQFMLTPEQSEQLVATEGEDGQQQLLLSFAKDLPVENRTLGGAPRYCEKCKSIKPDRCHHCSVCDMCVLKMDHHCPWVNNCVSFTNYKFFVLFLGYGLIYCMFIAASSLEFFIMFWTSTKSESMGRFHILFLFFVAVMFGLSLISLFSYHCFLSFKNRSTLESFRAPVFRTGPDKEGFSLGSYANFCEIYGDDKLKWFLPLFTSRGDGVTFPTRNISTQNSYQTMGNTPTPTSTSPSMGDGVTFPTRTVDNDGDGLLAERQRWMEEGEANGFVGSIEKGQDNEAIHLA